MSNVDEEKVTKFIRDKALHGPEVRISNYSGVGHHINQMLFQGTYPKEGQFTQGLIKQAEIPPGSSNEDSVLCPNYI